jgi:hypothetical protein
MSTESDYAVRPALFNSRFETGVRAVFILAAFFPRRFDLERLVALDHFVVHTADLGGPDSMHPSTSSHATEMLVRRELVQDGLLLMQSRNLVDRQIASDGISYAAGTEAASFLHMLETEYSKRLSASSKFLAELLKDMSDNDLDFLVDSQLERWAIHFQPVSTVRED